MENALIIGILVIAVGFGIYSSVRHFKGESGCCGGGSYRPRKKKLSKIRYQKIFLVDGMHCDRCKNRVEEIVNDMDGIAGKVNLKRGELVVSYEKSVDDDAIREKIYNGKWTTPRQYHDDGSVADW